MDKVYIARDSPIQRFVAGGANAIMHDVENGAFLPIIKNSARTRHRPTHGFVK